jgi:hypothetical protein
MLIAQSIPYVSALVTSLIAAMPPATFERIRRIALPFASRTSQPPQPGAPQRT